MSERKYGGIGCAYGCNQDFLTTLYEASLGGTPDLLGLS